MLRMSAMRLFVVLALVAGCKKMQEPGAVTKVVVAADAATAAATATELGPLREGDGVAMVVVYYLPMPSTAPRPVFDAAMARQNHFKVVEDLTPDVAAPAVAFVGPLEPPPWVPDAEAITFMSRGLDDTQRAAVTQSKAAVALGFVFHADNAIADLRRAHEVAGQLAAKTGGLVWIDPTRLVYGPAAWEKRVAAAAEDPPDVSGLINMHAYQIASGGLRVVTLGMSQFGLPELVLDDVPATRSKAGESLVNAVAQRFIEGHGPRAGGRLELEVEGRTVELVLVAATPEEGDNPGRLWRIDFPGGGSYSERFVATTTKLYGISDEVNLARNDDAELIAASKRAKDRLSDVAARFAKGLPLGEHLSVKAPVGTPPQVEFMWIEVRRWERGTIQGVLMNQPMYPGPLKEGDEVAVAERDVYDWMINRSDGTQEGGETDEILMKRRR
jgi:uncharacterized protein YegJ (DUF2314 family)